MTKKGYASEYLAKKELESLFGKGSVLKLAIGQVGPDFLVLEGNVLRLVVEVKECHGEKYYPSAKEKEQFERIKTWCQEHRVSMFWLMIHYPKRREWCKSEMTIQFPDSIN